MSGKNEINLMFDLNKRVNFNNNLFFIIFNEAPSVGVASSTVWLALLLKMQISLKTIFQEIYVQIFIIIKYSLFKHPNYLLVDLNKSATTTWSIWPNFPPVRLENEQIRATFTHTSLKRPFFIIATSII